MKMSLNVW